MLLKFVKVIPGVSSVEPVASSKVILQVKIFKLTLRSQIQNIFIVSYSSESHSLIKGVSRWGLQTRSRFLAKNAILWVHQEL